jgi:hypothetical protein
MKRLTVISVLFLILSFSLPAQVVMTGASRSLFDTVSPANTTAAPTFSLSAASALPMYTTVTISSATSGASVCYTVDGTAPTVNGAGACTNGSTTATYTMTPTVSTVTINAMAVATSMLASATSSITYTIDKTIPVYLGGAEHPTNSSSASSITTSSSVAVTAGQLLHVFCVADAAASIAISDSASDTFTKYNYFQRPDTFETVQSGYAFAKSSGNVTFTCTPASSTTGQLIVAQAYYPGSLTGLDSQVSGTTYTASTSYTSPTFSTTAKGLIISCVKLLTYGTYTAGAIGAQTATIRQVAGWTGAGNGACEDTITNPAYPAQSNITAGISNTASGNWIGSVGAFK